MTSIPDKLYFKIGEVSDITGLEAYVLRFWETEFKKINPKRTESGQRLYSKKDVELILNIKNLLHKDKFTIQGAKQYLNSGNDKKKNSSEFNLEKLKSELIDIKEMLQVKKL